MTALAEAGVGAHERDHGYSSGQTGERAPAAKIGGGDFLLVSEEAKLEAVMGAGANAVHAHQAFGFAPWGTADRIVSTLAIQQAAIAFIARGWIFVQSQNRPARDRAE
jgi:hypothetical protein